MATNRFDRGINPVQIGTPVQLPFEEIVMALGMHQSRYDQSKKLLDALDEKQFQNLDVDTEFANQARMEQSQLVDNLLQMNAGDLSASAGDIEREVRKFARRYGPQGDIGKMQAAYTKALAEFEEIDKSDLPSNMKSLAKEEMLYNYGNIMKGAKTDAFGNTVYNTFGDANVPEYVNVYDKALELADKMDPQKIAENTGWYKRNGVWYKDSSMTEVLSEEDIVAGITPFLSRDPKVRDYLNFDARLRTMGMTDQELRDYNESIRTQTADYNMDLLKRKGEIVNKLNDPSKFKTAKEYQFFINKVFGKNVITPDGDIGPKTKAAAQKAIDYVNKNMTTKDYTPRDLAGVRQDMVTATLEDAITSAGSFFETYNVTKKDQTMKFDPYDLYAWKKAFDKSLEEEAGEQVNTEVMQLAWGDTNPFTNNKLYKVKSDGEMIMEYSTAAEPYNEAAEFFHEPEQMAATPVTSLIMYLGNKAVAAWHSTFNKDRADFDHPDLQHAKNNLEYLAETSGINTDGYTDEQWMEALGEHIEAKTTRAGINSFNRVVDKKAKDNWEVVWGPKISKGKGKEADKVTNAMLGNRRIYDQEGNIVDGGQLRKKLNNDGPLSYLGTNKSIVSGLEYGTEVIKIGDKEYYVDPTDTDKADPAYFASGVLRARYAPTDINYFEAVQTLGDGIPRKLNFRSSHDMRTDTYEVQVQTKEGWETVETYKASDFGQNPE